MTANLVTMWPVSAVASDGGRSCLLIHKWKSAIYLSGLDNSKFGLLHNAVILPDIVAKCERYGRYICVKILEGRGKKSRRPHSFVKLSSFGANSTSCYEVMSLNTFI